MLDRFKFRVMPISQIRKIRQRKRDMRDREKAFLEAHALHDICVQIGFETTADRLEKVFDELEREGK